MSTVGTAIVRRARGALRVLALVASCTSLCGCFLLSRGRGRAAEPAPTATSEAARQEPPADEQTAERTNARPSAGFDVSGAPRRTSAGEAR